jgi:DNA-binding IclR family transcriptional regulator
LVSIAKPLIDQLSVDCDNETSYLGYFQNFKINTLILQKSPKMLGLGSSVSDHTVIHTSSMGKCMLAFMSPGEYKKWRDMTPTLKRLTDNTITSFDALEEELAVIREQGYSENRSENEEGIYTMACPIFNNVGKAIACAAIGIPQIRYTEEKKRKFILEVMKQAESISSQIGYFETN